MANTSLTLFNKFDIKNFKICEFEGEDKFGNKNAKIKYNDMYFFLQSPLLEVKSNNVMKLGGKIQSIKDLAHFRSHIIKQLVVESSNPDDEDTLKDDIDNTDIKIRTYYDIFTQIDNYCGTDAFKKEKFQKQWQGYKYIPLVKSPPIPENKKYYEYLYKFVKPRIFYKDVKDEENPNAHVLEIPIIVKGENNTQIDTFDKLRDILTFGSKYKLILSFSKMYVKKQTKEYGIVLYVHSIEIQPNIKINNKLQFLADSDEEVELKNQESLEKLKITEFKEEEEHKEQVLIK